MLFSNSLGVWHVCLQKLGDVQITPVGLYGYLLQALYSLYGYRLYGYCLYGHIQALCYLDIPEFW